MTLQLVPGAAWVHPALDIVARKVKERKGYEMKMKRPEVKLYKKKMTRNEMKGTEMK
jgi:hypothetical protein